MPRNVRNFWVSLSVDGNNSDVSAGPRMKDGGFKLTILQRENGEISEAISVYGAPTLDGETLILSVYDNRTNSVLYTLQTKR